MLTIRNMSKRYDGHEVDALSDISLDVPQGSFTTLLGPSGCGKSTLLRCVAGLEDPRTGAISLAGKAVFDADRRLAVPPNRRALGMVFQSYAIWPHMTVGGNIGYPLKVRREDAKARREAVEEALALVDLAGYADRPAYSLSGGQQQRVALARAIISRPALLLLDEPMSNLDESLRRQLGQQLRALQRSLNLTALYVTHDRNEALTMSDEIVVMREGRIVERGSPLDLYFRPRTVAGARAVGEVNVLAARPTPEGGALCDLFEPSLVADECAHAEDIALVVRPEHLQVLDAPPPDGRPSAPARVVSTTFGGSMSEVEVALSDDTRALHRSIRPPNFSPGDAVRVAVDPEQVHAASLDPLAASAAPIAVHPAVAQGADAAPRTRRAKAANQ